MRNIKLKIAYDGTDFCGWQIQKNGRTVQGDVESALKTLHAKSIRVTGSGRTDSGVHANGQIANFFANSNIPADKYMPALNSLLRNDVRIIKSVEVPESFHARYDAKKRIYHYYIKPGGVCNPMYSRFCWNIRNQPNLIMLNRIASVLIGVHDFTSFTAAGDKSETKFREVFSACFYYKEPFIIFRIAGNAFLWKMVRSIVGTIIGLETMGGNMADMEKILKSCNRDKAGKTAPACGLFLDRVTYE